MTTISYDPHTRAWHEYTPHGRTPIHCQRLARIAPTAAPQGDRVRRDGRMVERHDTSGAVLLLAFYGAFSGALAVMLLVKELFG